MTLDIRLAIEIAGLFAALLTQWFLLRAKVSEISLLLDQARKELERLIGEAQRRADAAHARLDKHQDEVTSVRLDIREVMTRLGGLGEISQRLDALMLAVRPKED